MQFFFITAGKPSFGLVVVLLGGATNILLDYVFIGLFGWGMTGAAMAAGIGFSVPSFFGLTYFALQKKGTLYFVRPKINPGVFLKSCVNGSSEKVTNLAAAVITFLYNVTTMRLLGADGVAAITVALYAEFFLVAVFLGYSSEFGDQLHGFFMKFRRIVLFRFRIFRHDGVSFGIQYDVVDTGRQVWSRLDL